MQKKKKKVTEYDDVLYMPISLLGVMSETANAEEDIVYLEMW
jgi:hypothetical protein